MTKPTKKPAPKSAPAPKSILTRAVAADRALENVETRAEYALESSRRNLAAFIEKFTKDAAHALEWSHSIFSAAADESAALLILEFIKSGRSGDEYSAHGSEAILREIRRWLSEEVIRKARWPDHSTSPTANEMSLSTNAARAEWLTKIEEALERLDREDVR